MKSGEAGVVNTPLCTKASPASGTQCPSPKEWRVTHSLCLLSLTDGGLRADARTTRICFVRSEWSCRYLACMKIRRSMGRLVGMWEVWAMRRQENVQRIQVSVSRPSCSHR